VGNRGSPLVVLANLKRVGSVVRVHGDGNPCERGLSDAAGHGAPVAQNRAEKAAVTDELGPAVTDRS
jgi:hypothetical protein